MTRSGVNGTWRSRTPVASKIALHKAAATGTVASSPAPDGSTVNNVDWQHRAQFFAISAQMMRRILVDAARARGSHKRGGGAVRVNVDEVPVLSPEPDASLVALDDALEALSKIAPRQAKIVELRYFGGLSEEETGEVLKIYAKRPA